MAKQVSTQIIHRGGRDDASTKSKRTGKQDASSSQRRQSTSSRGVDTGSEQNRTSAATSLSQQLEDATNQEVQVTAPHRTVQKTTGGGTRTVSKVSEGYAFTLVIPFNLGIGSSRITTGD